MLSWLEELGLTLVIGVLSKVIKNPAAHKSMVGVLTHIRDDATLAVAALDPNAAPPPGYVKA